LPRKILQSFIVSLILLICSLNFEGLRFLIITLLSSANKVGFDGTARIMFGRSFIKIKKNKRRSIEPSGTPCFLLKGSVLRKAVIYLLHSYALMHCSTALSFVVIILLKCIAIC